MRAPQCGGSDRGTWIFLNSNCKAELKQLMLNPPNFDVFWNNQEPRDVTSPPGNLLEIIRLSMSVSCWEI